jgi:hypothetical protein
MKYALIQKVRKLSVALLPSLLLTIAQSSAQNVEVVFRLDVTVWPHSNDQQTEHRKIYNGRCIFGTGGWLIERGNSLDTKTTWWCDGTNIFQQSMITKELPEAMKHLRTAGGIAVRNQPIGERFSSRRYGRSDRQPLDSISYCTWLAFCSGSFLKSDGRTIVPPMQEWEEDYSDKSRVFHDAFSLPESIEIYGQNNKLIYSYRVLQTTNYSGCTVPVRFEVIENYSSRVEAPKPRFRGVGTVTSIHDSPERATPANR